MTMNVYPATVTIGDVATLRNARVRTNNAENERVQVWVDRNHQCVLVLDALVAQTPKQYNMWAPQPDRNAQLILADPAGTVVFVQGEGGCGCGSPLRALPPWQAFTEHIDMVGAA